MFDLDPSILPLLAGLLLATAVMVVIYVLLVPYMSGEKQTASRIVSVTETRAGRQQRRIQAEQIQSRRRAVADTLKDLEKKAKAKEKITLRASLARAGLDITERNFWVLSAVCGLLVTGLVYISAPSVPIPILFVVLFAATLGLPRFILGRMIMRRQKKFVDEFPDALDVITRGVKSGLPINECIGIIARETPEPVRGVFADVIDQQRVGVPLGECLERATDNMPVSELKFFAIVISIQQQAGGNLSETLGNLSGVIRSRKQLAAKVQSLSAEAKASAMVLGAMPFVVTGLIYLSTPAYIMTLFNTRVGQFMLICSAVWMTLGILTMRKMINFKF